MSEPVTCPGVTYETLGINVTCGVLILPTQMYCERCEAIINQQAERLDDEQT